MKFLYNPSTDAPFNLALEELAAEYFEEDIFMLWRNRSAVIVGRNQNTAAEVDSDYARNHDIQIVRRMTGGGAVYHDLGNVNYTICTAGRLLEDTAFSQHASCVVSALRKMDIPAEFSGRNDILVEGKKISGSAKTVLSSRTLFHGTLLFETDLSTLEKVLTPDPEKIRAKGIKSVRSRVGNLRDYLQNFTVDNFITALAEKITSETGAVWCEIPTELQQKAARLADEKYRTWQWNYGTPMVYSYTKKKRFDFGSLQVDFNVVNNCIADLTIRGDFFGNRSITELCALLEGNTIEPELLAQKLQTIPISTFISGASAEDLLPLFDL